MKPPSFLCSTSPNLTCIPIPLLQSPPSRAARPTAAARARAPSKRSFQTSCSAARESWTPTRCILVVVSRFLVACWCSLLIRDLCMSPRGGHPGLPPGRYAQSVQFVVQPLQGDILTAHEMRCHRGGSPSRAVTVFSAVRASAAKTKLVWCSPYSPTWNSVGAVEHDDWPPQSTLLPSSNHLPSAGRRARRRRRQPALRNQPEPAVGARQPGRIRRCGGSGGGCRGGHVCGCFHDERTLAPGALCCA